MQPFVDQQLIEYLNKAQEKYELDPSMYIVLGKLIERADSDNEPIFEIWSQGDLDDYIDDLLEISEDRDRVLSILCELFKKFEVLI